MALVGISIPVHLTKDSTALNAKKGNRLNTVVIELK